MELGALIVYHFKMTKSIREKFSAFKL